MFENLKAFIRHGKQANDMKRKQQQQPQQYQQPFSTATANENPFQQASNETPDSSNVITPNDIINEYQQPDKNHNNTTPNNNNKTHINRQPNSNNSNKEYIPTIINPMLPSMTKTQITIE